MTLLKPASMTLAAASLLGLAALAPVHAQTAYPATGTGYPAGQPGPGYPGAESAYSGPQPAYPGMQPGYQGPQPGYQGYPAAPPAPQTGYAAPGILTQVVTNGPQANVEQQQPNWSAPQNVIQSHRYTRLVETNPGFRAARLRKECDPITDPQLHQQCVASFNGY